MFFDGQKRFSRNSLKNQFNKNYFNIITLKYKKNLKLIIKQRIEWVKDSYPPIAMDTIRNNFTSK